MEMKYLLWLSALVVATACNADKSKPMYVRCTITTGPSSPSFRPDTDIELRDRREIDELMAFFPQVGENRHDDGVTVPWKADAQLDFTDAAGKEVVIYVGFDAWREKDRKFDYALPKGLVKHLRAVIAAHTKSKDR